MTDDCILKGFGVFASEDEQEFVDGVEEARERMDREFRERADELFSDR